MKAMEDWRAGFDERYPIYEQIINRFCRSLVRGELLPGERIPSIRDTALLLKVNTNTIQRAYQEMERRELIYSQRGTGYFVMQEEAMVEKLRDEMVRESTSRFLAEMGALGFDRDRIFAELKKQLEEEGKKHADHTGA